MPHHDHDHDRCMELFERFSEYLDGELDAYERRSIEQHIRACCHCHICFETLKRTVDFCRNTPDVPVPSALTDRLNRLIQDLARKP